MFLLGAKISSFFPRTEKKFDFELESLSLMAQSEHFSDETVQNPNRRSPGMPDFS
jgi:hypothetical protein